MSAAASLPKIAIIAAGAMGGAVGKRLTIAGLTVFTNLDGRSEATRKRATDAGLKDVKLEEIALQANWVLSILPPSDAYAFAEKFLDAHKKGSGAGTVRFADCNAVNPETVKRIAKLFNGTGIPFIDAGIIGGPPREGYDPKFYASADDEALLDYFAGLKRYGLNVVPLKGEGVGIGDASALKMSYAGITKGLLGLATTMILSAHAASPSTAQALANEIYASQPEILSRITKFLPGMPVKAYRWVGEMEEIAEFTRQSGGEGQGEAGRDIYRGLAGLYERIEGSLNGDGADVQVLNEFLETAKQLEGGGRKA